MSNLFIFSCCMLAFLSFIGIADSDCQFGKIANKETIAKKRMLLKRLENIEPKRFKIDTTSSDGHKHSYLFGICSDAESDKLIGENAGVVQINTKDEEPKEEHVVVGRYNETDIFAGDNWVLLSYGGGQAYASFCNSEPRKALIVVICDRNAKKPRFKFIEENRDKESDCFYAFELVTAELCQAENKKTDKQLSSGSVFCIIFFTIAGMYLLIGSLYRRIVVGAKGLEQVPNYAFWKAFGNLTADGCDFVCRCGERHDAKMYQGIDDHLTSDFSESERDDVLLRP